MKCVSCGKANLPGGVRCSYCGAAFPVAPGFDLGAPPATTPTAPESPAAAGDTADLKTRAAGGLVALLLLLFKGKSLLALLNLGKIATTLGTMLAFIAAEAAFFGWRLGVGIAVCILIHELGHVFVNWRKGLAQSAPMFIPFAGAVIFLKQFPDNPAIQSESGAGGPIAGGLAAFGCLAIYAATDDPFWRTLAFFGFLINLFNLAPFPPLDGSHIVTVFSPALWSAVLVGMLLYVLKVPTSPLWMVLLVGFIFRLGHPDHGRHLLAPPIVRARMALIYLLVCLSLAWGIQQSFPAPRNAAASAPASASRDRATDPQVRQPRPSPETVAESKPHLDVEYIETVALVNGIAFLMWAWIAALLARAARVGWRRLGWIALFMTAMLVANTVLRALGLLSRSVTGEFLFGWLVATGGGFIYALYARLRPGAGAAGPTALGLRCLGWSGAAALALAYMHNNLWLAGAVAVGALAVWTLRPYVPPMLAASLAESMGDIDRAIALRRQAVDRGAPADLGLQWRIAQGEAMLDRGEAALAALEDVAAATPDAPGTLAFQEQRIEALTLVGRIDEALRGCEEILIPSAGDPQGAFRLMVVHLALARLAFVRGWWDEALAQIAWCHGATPPGASRLTAFLSAMEASIRIETGDLSGARAAADRALASSREPRVTAAVASVRAAIALAEGDAAAARQELAPAVRALPSSLPVRYWRGRIDRATGAADSLNDLAAAHPTDYWGIRARQALVGS